MVKLSKDRIKEEMNESKNRRQINSIVALVFYGFAWITFDLNNLTNIWPYISLIFAIFYSWQSYEADKQYKKWKEIL